MTVATATDVLTISVDYACCGHDLAADLHAQLNTGAYDRCSAMPLPSHIDEWRAEHRTARKRVDRCRRRGYTFRALARERHEDEIHAINVSLDRRQGRPMSAGYLERQTFTPLPAYPCARHGVRTWGVWSPENELVAYLAMYRAGDLALVSQILGHGEHLENEIMYLLMAGALEYECREPGVLTYNRHDSGQPGLRFYKERVGLVEREVEWAL